jgi:hypothetical protein
MARGHVFTLHGKVDRELVISVIETSLLVAAAWSRDIPPQRIR